jgi:hypothetical protein
MFVYCVLSGSGLCDELITRPEGPTDCGALLCVIRKPRERGGHRPRWAAVPEKIIIISYNLRCNISCTSHVKSEIPVLVGLFFCQGKLLFSCSFLLVTQTDTCLDNQLYLKIQLFSNK